MSHLSGFAQKPLILFKTFDPEMNHYSYGGKKKVAIKKAKVEGGFC